MFSADSASDLFKKNLVKININVPVMSMHNTKANIYGRLIDSDTGILEKSKNNWHGNAMKKANRVKYVLLSSENKENFAVQ